MWICFHFLLYFRHLSPLFFLHLSPHTAGVTESWSTSVVPALWQALSWADAESEAVVSGEGSGVFVLTKRCPLSSGLHWESLGLLVWINAGGSHMSSEVALQCTQPLWGLSLSGIYCLILLVSRSNQCKYADVLSCARLLEMGQWCWWTLILRQNTLANRPSESCWFETHCYPDSRVQPQIGPHRHWCHTEFTTSLWHRNLDSKPPHPGPSSTNSGFLTDPAAPCQDPGWGFGGLWL